MKAYNVGVVAETHLNDLQADMEFGSRQIEQLHDDASHIRAALLDRQLAQAALMGSLIRRISELRACVQQQRSMMRDLRHDIRALRAEVQKG